MLKQIHTYFSSLSLLMGWASITMLSSLLVLKIIYKVLWKILSNLINYDSHLKGKVILITGASSGLGRAMAHALYKRGCKLILASRNVAKLNELKKELIEKYHPPEVHIPHIVSLDIQETTKVPKIIHDAVTLAGQIDILINNAGISYRGEADVTDLSVDVQMMMVNYIGQLAVTKAVIPFMRGRKQGHIISISSVQGKISLPYRSCYSASKHALQAFMDSLRAELFKHKIDVTVVSPGYLRTDLSKNALTAQEGHVYGKIDDTQAGGWSTDYAAEQVIQAMYTKEKEVWICPLSNKIAIYIRTLVPALYFYIMSLRAKKQGTQKKND